MSRNIRLRARYPFVQEVLYFAYRPCFIAFHETEQVYIVTYRGRRIAFSARGGHIATGTIQPEENNETLSNREQFLISMDIAERALLAAKFLD